MNRKAFPGYGAEVETHYARAGHWLRATIFGNEASGDWCKANGVPVRKAAGEGIGSTGAFLVPTELAKAIVDIRDSYGAFRRRAMPWPMASDAASISRRIGGANAFFFAENSAASSPSSAQERLVDRIGLTAKKMGSLTFISSELEEDATPDAVDYIANEIAYAFALKEDDCAFNGDGTSTYGGISGITQIVLDGKHTVAKVVAASGHNTFLTLDATDIANLMQAVKAAAIPNAAWFCSQTGFAQTFCRLAGAAGGAYLYTAEVDGIVTPFYLGFPVILCQKLPLVTTTLTGKGMMAFGDMYNGAVLGQRRGITIALSPERYLDQDQIGILGTERFDAVIHDMGDVTNAGMLAVLCAP